MKVQRVQFQPLPDAIISKYINIFFGYIEQFSTLRLTTFDTD